MDYWGNYQYARTGGRGNANNLLAMGPQDQCCAITKEGQQCQLRAHYTVDGIPVCQVHSKNGINNGVSEACDFSQTPAPVRSRSKKRKRSKKKKPIYDNRKAYKAKVGLRCRPGYRRSKNKKRCLPKK